MVNLRAWCRGMNAFQVDFFLGGSLWLAALSFLFLCAALVLLWRRKTALRRVCGGLVALCAAASWGFLSLVAIQSGKILHLYYGGHPIVPATYVLFLFGGLILCVVRRRKQEG